MTNSRRGGRGEGDAGKGKGKGKSKGDAGAPKGEGKKGGGKGKKGEASSRSAPAPPPQDGQMQAPFSRAKTVQELEAEMLLAKNGGGDATKERREVNKQALEIQGNFCEVKKHSDMGCAVITFTDQAARDYVMRLAEKKGVMSEKSRPLLQVGGIDVELRAHTDKAGTQHPRDIFIAWGRQTEKNSPLAPSALAEAIDTLVFESRGGQPAQENGVQSPPLMPVAPPLPGAVQQPLQQMAAPMQLAQHLLPPAVVPGSQPQQANYVDLMSLWAAQQQHAAQQQAAMQAPPPSPPPPSPPPQEAARTSPAVLETPPRQGTSAMRAAAPEFSPYTPPPVQYNVNQYVNGTEYNADYNFYGAQEAMAPPRKQFQIVNPETKEAIDLPANDASAPQQGVVEFKPRERRQMEIFNPKNGEKVDTLGMLNFSPAKAAQTFSITDPNSGKPVHV